jgi:hypothetical protein
MPEQMDAKLQQFVKGVRGQWQGHANGTPLPSEVHYRLAFRGEQISRWKDYRNPMSFLSATGALDSPSS